MHPWWDWPRFGIGTCDVSEPPGCGAMARSKLTLASARGWNASANLGGSCRNQGVLVGHNIEQRGCAKLVFLLFGVQGLLIEVACLRLLPAA